ncbi:Clathrin interactor EPSIN 2 [Striga hermonthica]|uniref:Clathrin interactor EPSIN 2 n=1 Tax=Striga hermonthica TaxID=68872 RepID=A0A9N7N0R4_STRHE|nr:Clathrin interactor EPSIN 2 [Striga hermonthica]
MKKAFGQTVRDLKREVNKKVLKVPSIEQKVLDATSNEPWGPHGSLLADIANATRNYHEYQMIMSVIWKRTNDTGKNWRHVYKALTVLEYLVAHGSERVIDDIKEHAYQISTLSDFQYIDSSGKDQGSNVRKKSQSLVVLVNDKERIQEVRQKAAVNRDKYRSTPAGGMYRPGSGGYGDRYDDDRYGNRDDDRNSYGREREWGSRDDDRYGRDGDRYGKDYEERSGRDGYRENDYRGRGQSTDEYSYESRSRSADRDRSRSSEDDGQYSSRGSGAKADDQSQDGSSTARSLDRKYSGQSFGVPPSYEDAVGGSRSPPYSERDGDSSLGYAPKASSPKGASPSYATSAGASPSAPVSPPASVSAPASVITPGSAPTLASAPAVAPAQLTTQNSRKEADGFDEFDPRGSFSAAPVTSNGAISATSAADMDLLGSLSEFALVPVSQPTLTPEANASLDFSSRPANPAAASPEATINNQAFDDPFGDGPFKAIPSADSVSTQQEIPASTNAFNTNFGQSIDVPQQVLHKAATEIGSNPYEETYMTSGNSGVQPLPASTQFVKQELSNPSQELDILADILPPSAPSSFANAQPGYQLPPNQSVLLAGVPQTDQAPPPTGFPQTGPQPSNLQAQSGLPSGFHNQLGQFSSQTGYPLQSTSSPQTGFPTQGIALSYPIQGGQPPQMGFQPQSGPTQPNPNFYGAYNSQPASTGPVGGYMAPPASASAAQNNFLSQLGGSAALNSSNLLGPTSINTSSTGSSAIAPQPSKDKFETKSTVWADTLSRGLVNLNISGPKTNPLADIGVDFDAINRKEKRMEKPTAAAAAVTSTLTMGKAMGSGSGMGRAGATTLRPPANSMMGPMGMGGYGVGQPAGRGMGMGMGMNMPGNMGMGINMQPPMGAPPGSTLPGPYNHMGSGVYGQQPYGGGYR